MSPRKSRSRYTLISAIQKIEQDLRALERTAQIEMVDPECRMVGEIRLELIAESLRSLKLIAIGRKYREK